MDFVHSATGKSVNSPFKFELYAVLNPKFAWLCPGGSSGGPLRSVERCFSVKQKDIRPGVEKWVLQDGQTCVLKRPGMKSVRFTVPIRPLIPDASSPQEEMDELDFPEYAQPVQ